MEDQNKTDQTNNGKGPISSGRAPGPGEHLVGTTSQPYVATSRQDDATAALGGPDTTAWQWPRSEDMAGEDSYFGGQAGSRTMLQSAGDRIRGSKGTFLVSTVAAGFLLQRFLQSAPAKRAARSDAATTPATQYGADASLDADRRYGVETAYAPDTSYQADFSGGADSASTGTMNRLTDRVRQAGGNARARLQATTAGTKARLSDMGTRTKSQYYRAKDRVDSMQQEQPLLLGALGLAVGAGLGAMLAVTRRENELLGGMRDKVVGKARETASSQMQSVKESAQRFAEFAKEEARRKKDELSASVGQGSVAQTPDQPSTLATEKARPKTSTVARPGSR